MDDQKREIMMTADGSPTISIPAAGVTYHSTHGAVQESMHVFIRSGLDEAMRLFEQATLEVFEMGFGTGLNAGLTWQVATQMQRKIRYTAVELFPLREPETEKLQYELNGVSLRQLHAAPWEETTITEHFSLHKVQTSLQLFPFQPEQFHLIYYDAFAPGYQPELWTQEVFEQLYRSLVPGGLLVTYCSKSIVRKALQAAGFLVEKLPGPPGKREILRAIKPAVSLTS